MEHAQSRSHSLYWLNSLTLLGVVMTAASAVFLFYLVPNFIGEPAFLDNPMMSPRWLPNLVGWGLLLLSLVLVLQGVLTPPKDKARPPVEKGVPFYRWGLMVLVCIFYLTLFKLLGAIGSGILCTALLFLAAGTRHLKVYAWAIVFPVLVSLLFIHLLNVPLPIGELWL